MGDKARDPRACSARGLVLYIPYVPYLGIVYVICVTAESNYFGNHAKTCTAPRRDSSRDLYNIKP